MKVVILHTDFRIYWPSRLKALSAFLKEKEIELQIIEIADQGSPYSFDGNNNSEMSSYYCLFPGRKIEDLSPKTIRKAITSKLDFLNPDVLIAGAPAFFSGANAIYWASKNKKKVVIFDDARLSDVPRSPIVNFVKKEIFTQVDSVFCPSSDWIDTFTFFGLKKEQLFFGINAVDNEFWKKPNENVFESYHLPKRYFLIVGRQVPKKNLFFMLDAYKSYSDLIEVPIPLVLVGEGPERFGLELKVANEKIENVHFIGFQNQDVLKFIYKNAELLILPSSIHETWGLVVNEAMASGIPVLVSNKVGCANSLVKEGFNGFTFSPDSMEDLKNALIKFHSMPADDRINLSQNSLEIISNWGIERFCEGAYQSVLYSISNRKKRSGFLIKVILLFWKGRYRLA